MTTGAMELREKSIPELLALDASVRRELGERGVLRTENVVGDWAEHLFCGTFGWQQHRRSAKGSDATGKDGARYQIKGRRVAAGKDTRPQLEFSSLKGFDVLAAVLFNDTYGVVRAALIPVAVVRNHPALRTNKLPWVLPLRNDVWDSPGVKNVTSDLRAYLSREQ